MTSCATHREVVDTLREENARLHHTLRRLRDELFTPTLVHPDWGLSAIEARIFDILAKRQRVTLEGLMVGLFSHRCEELRPDTPQSHISKMRRKLAPYGIRITNERFLGYKLEGFMIIKGERDDA